MKIRSLLILEEQTAPSPSTSTEPSSITFAGARSSPPPSTAIAHSTALTALILLLALFFLCFFSVYARSFLAGLHRSSSRRRHQNDSAGRSSEPAPRRRLFSSSRAVVDESVVSSLPVLYYVGGEGESCVVCLAEFEAKEQVKVIPGCGHVFHVACIDAWLLSRGSCPVCRCTNLVGGAAPKEARVGAAKLAESPAETTEEGRERVVVVGLEKSGSCSWSLGEVDKAELFLRRSSSWRM